MRWQKAHLWYQSSDASKGLSQSVKALELLSNMSAKNVMQGKTNMFLSTVIHKLTLG